MSGMTVVAASRPPLMEAMVLRYGTPTPLATPISADPATRKAIPVPQARTAYPARNPNGATYLMWRGIRFINLPNSSPMAKATTSNPTMMKVMVPLSMPPPVAETMAKLVG